MWWLADVVVVVLSSVVTGAMGVLSNGDWVESMLPPSSTRRFVNYPDGGVFMDVMPARMCDNPEVHEQHTGVYEGGVQATHGVYEGGVFRCTSASVLLVLDAEWSRW